MKDKRIEKRDDSYFASSRRKRKRYMKIYIPIIAAVAIALGALFILGAQSNTLGSKMVLHLHPHLNVTADGTPVTIPTNIGIEQLLYKDHSLDRYGMQGMAPLHTHDSSGTIHVESNTNRTYTVGEFLDIWGGLDLNGKILKVTVDNKPVPDYRNIILKDGEQINLQVGK
jgi:diadenosine tetraphosphate (Ap4A) HIT family hydrolase